MAIEGSVPLRLWGSVTGRWKPTRARAVGVSATIRVSATAVTYRRCLPESKAARVYSTILRAATVDRTKFGCLQAGFRNPARSRQAARRSGAARDVEAVGAVAAGVILLALHLTEGPEAVEAVVFS